MEKAKYLLVGGFAAGQAAQSIREHDKAGRIVILGQEPHPPYDRPPLSKDALFKDDFASDDSYSKPDDYYQKNDIEVQSGVRVTGIDREKRVVELDSGAQIGYEKLLLATGATPREMPVPGKDIWGVFYLRVIEDSSAIRNALKQAKRAVVIGASYLGLEVASGCLKRGLETTIIEKSDRPWPKFASDALGQFMREQYEEAGAKFLFGDEVTEFSGNGHLAKVHTKHAGEIDADVCIACIGVTLNTQLSESAGLEVDEKDGVLVNEKLQTSDPHIWAAGDIACFQDVALGKRWHVEHFMNAKWQGQAAGALMAGAKEPFDKVAYFFSDFLDLHMILRGDPEASKSTSLRGDLARRDFVELHADAEGVLRCAVAISPNEEKLEPLSDKLEEFIRTKKKVDEIEDADLSL